MGYINLTDEEMMELVNDISNNVPHKELSEKYNVTIADIHLISKKSGIVQAKRKERLKFNERVIELYQEGYNYAEISKIVGCSHSNVTQILDRYGIPRHHGRRNKDVIKRNEEIARLYQTGNYTRVELGKMFNLSSSYVGAIINETLHKSTDRSLNVKDDTINNMINEGKTNIEISQALNVPKTTLSSMYYNQNYRNRNNERDAKIIELYKSRNYTQMELANMFDLSVTSIANILRKYRNKNKNNSVK